jgi:hypothetical protein
MINNLGRLLAVGGLVIGQASVFLIIGVAAVTVLICIVQLNKLDAIAYEKLAADYKLCSEKD